MDVHLLEIIQNKTYLSNIDTDKTFSNTYKSDHGRGKGKKGVL